VPRPARNVAVNPFFLEIFTENSSNFADSPQFSGRLVAWENASQKVAIASFCRAVRIRESECANYPSEPAPAKLLVIGGWPSLMSSLSFLPE